MLSKKNLLSIAAAAAIMASAPAAHAQWGSLLKAVAPKVLGTSAAAGDPVQVQEQTLANYKAASEQINMALVHLADAYGMKEQSALLQAEITALQSGAVIDKDAVAKNSALSSTTLDQITAKIAAGEALTDEGKAHYVNALAPFAKGLAIASLQLPKDFTAMGASYNAALANPMQAATLVPKLGTGMFLVSEVPKFTASTLTGFKQILMFAKNNQIEVPAEATQFLN